MESIPIVSRLLIGGDVPDPVQPGVELQSGQQSAISFLRALAEQLCGQLVQSAATIDVPENHPTDQPDSDDGTKGDYASGADGLTMAAALLTMLPIPVVAPDTPQAANAVSGAREASFVEAAAVATPSPEMRAGASGQTDPALSASSPQTSLVDLRKDLSGLGNALPPLSPTGVIERHAPVTPDDPGIEGEPMGAQATALPSTAAPVSEQGQTRPAATLLAASGAATRPATPAAQERTNLVDMATPRASDDQHHVDGEPNGLPLFTSRQQAPETTASQPALPPAAVSPAGLYDGLLNEGRPLQIHAGLSSPSPSGDRTVQATVSVPVGHPGWERALGEQILTVSRPDGQHAALHLRPPELGSVEVHVSVYRDQADVSFTSPHGVVREAIEAAVPRLRQMFADTGLILINVSVSHDSSAQHQSHSNGGHAPVASFATDPASRPEPSGTASAGDSAASVRGLVDDYV